jgi:hypothetical protein
MGGFWNCMILNYAHKIGMNGVWKTWRSNAFKRCNYVVCNDQKYFLRYRNSHHLGKTLTISLVNKVWIICHKIISLKSYSKENFNGITFMMYNSYFIDQNNGQKNLNNGRALNWTGSSFYPPAGVQLLDVTWVNLILTYFHG